MGEAVVGWLGVLRMRNRQGSSKRKRSVWRWLLRLRQAAIAFLVARRYPGIPVRGSGWRGVAGGLSHPEARAVEQALDDLFGKVSRTVRGDFGLTKGHEWPIVVAYARSSEDFGRLFPRLKQKHVLCPRSNSLGFCGPSLGLVVLTGVEGTEEFVFTAAHEFTHALCHAYLGATSSALWCVEGYASWVVSRVCQDRELARRALLREVRGFSKCQKSGLLLGTRELLMVAPRAWKSLGERSVVFGVQAALFFRFLLEQEGRFPGVRGLCLDFLGPYERQGAGATERIEQMCGRTIDELHMEFLEWWQELRSSGDLREPWERLDYWKPRFN